MEWVYIFSENWLPRKCVTVGSWELDSDLCGAPLSLYKHSFVIRLQALHLRCRTLDPGVRTCTGRTGTITESDYILWENRLPRKCTTVDSWELDSALCGAALSASEHPFVIGMQALPRQCRALNRSAYTHRTRIYVGAGQGTPFATNWSSPRHRSWDIFIIASALWNSRLFLVPDDVPQLALQVYHRSLVWQSFP